MNFILIKATPDAGGNGDITDEVFDRLTSYE
jgi:hypothetical protein